MLCYSPQDPCLASKGPCLISYLLCHAIALAVLNLSQVSNSVCSPLGHFSFLTPTARPDPTPHLHAAPPARTPGFSLNISLYSFFYMWKIYFYLLTEVSIHNVGSSELRNSDKAIQSGSGGLQGWVTHRYPYCLPFESEARTSFRNLLQPPLRDLALVKCFGIPKVPPLCISTKHS